MGNSLLTPLSCQVPIVDKDGKPLPYFQRFMQQLQAGENITVSSTGVVNTTGVLQVVDDTANWGAGYWRTVPSFLGLTIGDNSVEPSVTFAKGTDTTILGTVEMDLPGFAGGMYFGGTISNRVEMGSYGTITGLEFGFTPYVNSSPVFTGASYKMYHEGNLSFGSGLSYNAGTGVLTATGGAGGAWVEIGSWTWSANVPNVAFTADGSGNPLNHYSELMIVTRGIVRSVSGTDRVVVSTDGGVTYRSTSGDYVTVTIAGVEAAAQGFPIFGTGATAARSGTVRIGASNVNGVPKTGLTPNAANPSATFVQSTSPINAIRIEPTAGGNFTAGSIYVMGR